MDVWSLPGRGGRGDRDAPPLAGARFPNVDHLEGRRAGVDPVRVAAEPDRHPVVGVRVPLHGSYVLLSLPEPPTTPGQAAARDRVLATLQPIWR
jgi:hypothetical protein